MDEAQFFLNIKDSEFIATCRSARCCVVCLTQSLPALVGHFGENRTAAADGLIGKFANHVFHGNSCPRTNQWAADLIGKGIRLRANRSRSTGTSSNQGMNAGANTGSGDSSGTSYGNGSIGHNTGGSNSSSNACGDNLGRGQTENSSFGVAEQVDYLVEPAVFASALRSGGPANRNLVD